MQATNFCSKTGDERISPHIFVPMESTLFIKKYHIQHPLLKPLIKYFWVMRGREDALLQHKLLPVNSIDVVLNFSAPVSYEPFSAQPVIMQRCHIAGIRTRHSLISHSRAAETIGIAFSPIGLYSFMTTPVAELTDMTLDLDVLMPGFADRLQERFFHAPSLSRKLLILEQELLLILDTQFLPPEHAGYAVRQLPDENERLTIRQFCETSGIRQRTLERVFDKYVGVRPKLFQRLTRFQTVVRHMITSRDSRLTTVANEYEYYDQAHFINDFKRFAGCSPSQFLQERRSVKEVSAYL